MIVLKKLYINPMVDLSYIFRRFHEILRDEYNSFCEYCTFVKDRYIIYNSEDLNISSIKLSFISDYPPAKSILGLKRNNSSYYLSNPNDAEISGIVNIFVNDCKNYDACCQEELRYFRSDIISTMEVWNKMFSDKKSPSITKVLYSNPATIVFWEDGTKTVVKCQEGDKYSYAEGIMHAIIRKMFGNNKQYSDILKWISTAEEYDKTYEAVFKEEKRNDSSNNSNG